MSRFAAYMRARVPLGAKLLLHSERAAGGRCTELAVDPAAPFTTMTCSDDKTRSTVRIGLHRPRRSFARR